ncbi:MAG: DVU0772 family protein [Thermodesulfobacteriota bacterium]
MKSVRELLRNRRLQQIMDWDLHPFEAVTRYLEWGTNWSRGIDHAKSCNEESAYFKIDARDKPARLLLVRQSHKEYEVISQVEAPQELVDRSVEHFACKNAACGITDELRAWLRAEADKAA